MKDSTEHLGVLALGYLWNHPLQQLNDLFVAKHPDSLAPELTSALRKLTVEEKRALKRAITSIFAKDMTDFCTALDETARHGEVLEIKGSENRFSSHLPPWNDRLSYFDSEGDPKPEFLH
jgi:hypothetical protein